MRAPGSHRSVEVRPFPPNRRLVTGAIRAGRRMNPMHGLVEADVTRKMFTSPKDERTADYVQGKFG